MGEGLPPLHNLLLSGGCDRSASTRVRVGLRIVSCRTPRFGGRPEQRSSPELLFAHTAVVQIRAGESVQPTDWHA